MKKTNWQVLAETRTTNTMIDPRVLFSRMSKGRPRFYINGPAAKLMKIGQGALLQLQAPAQANGSPLLGLALVSTEKGAVKVKATKSSASLIFTTSAVENLKRQYKRIVYRPRVGRQLEGEPQWVLEPIESEKGAAA